jgi:restriction system protein
MSKSIELAKELEYQTLKALSENGGELTRTQLLDILRKTAKLDDWAKGTYEKTGYVRWESILQFYSIDLTKAGYIVKNAKNSTWAITEEGEAILKQGKEKIFETAQKLYKEWKQKSSECEVIPTTTDEKQIEQYTQTPKSILEDAQSKSYEAFEHFITTKFDPYSFQELCAALCRGMGYYTPYVAPRGKDGGVDIIAYKDPIGASYPHIKIQVKYRQETKATAQEIQQLKGTLVQGNDIGMFISLAGFTPDARNVAKTSNIHIELIDLGRFIELWQEFYDKLPDEDKSRMQITPVYFIAEE